MLLFFPDPWHKKRHHKRRIVQPDFLDAAARALAPGALLHCATDWQDYADWMIEHLEADARFENLAGPTGPSSAAQWRPEHPLRAARRAARPRGNGLVLYTRRG